MSSPDWFWKRADLYRQNGQCVYAEQCAERSDHCVPEECEHWQEFFDGECQADEILSE